MGCQLQLGGRWGRGAVDSINTLAVLMGKGLMNAYFCLAPTTVNAVLIVNSLYAICSVVYTIRLSPVTGHHLCSQAQAYLTNPALRGEHGSARM